MKHVKHTGAVLLLLGGGLSLVAWADEPKRPALKVGDLLESEFRYDRKSVETTRLDGDESISESARRIELTYIDRVDRLSEGRVVSVTRHFISVRLVEDGEARSVDLDGRNVVLRRGADDRFNASWEGGGALSGLTLFAAEVGPWPDVARSWGLAQGTRKGTLAVVPTLGWDRPDDVPALVEDMLEEFAMATTSSGEWKLEVSGLGASEAKVKARAVLKGHESEQLEEGPMTVDVVDTLTIGLRQRAATAQELPKGKAPPKPSDDGPEAPPSDEDEILEPPPEPEDEPVPGEEEDMDDPEEDEDLPEDDDEPLPGDEDPEPREE